MYCTGLTQDQCVNEQQCEMMNEKFNVCVSCLNGCLCVLQRCVLARRGPNFSKVGAGATVTSKVGRFWVFGSDCGYFGACVGHGFLGWPWWPVQASHFHVRLDGVICRYQMEVRWLYSLKKWVVGRVIG